VSTWPAQPDLWPAAWNANRRPISDFAGPSGSNTHVYFEGNYDYVNNEDYTYGNHEGRPVELEHQRFNSSGDRDAVDALADARGAPLRCHVSSAGVMSFTTTLVLRS
jgi:hypothetical protein